MGGSVFRKRKTWAPRPPRRQRSSNSKIKVRGVGVFCTGNTTNIVKVQLLFTQGYFSLSNYSFEQAVFTIVLQMFAYSPTARAWSNFTLFRANGPSGLAINRDGSADIMYIEEAHLKHVLYSSQTEAHLNFGLKLILADVN